MCNSSRRSRRRSIISSRIRRSRIRRFASRSRSGKCACLMINRSHISISSGRRRRHRRRSSIRSGGLCIRIRNNRRTKLIITMQCVSCVRTTRIRSDKSYQYSYH